MPAYRLSAPFDRPPLRRRLSGLAFALGVNLVLLLVLLGLGIIPPPPLQRSQSLTIDLLPESRRAAAQTRKTNAKRVEANRPVPKPPPIILPAKPTITPPPAPSKKPSPWIEMSKEDLAAADISKLPSAGAGGAGDSEVVGHGPNGEALYNAEWAREPTNAELGGYLPHNVTGWGLIACKTVPNNRVDDCLELDQSPHGSHLASAVRQAAWQFRVRPPRKGGRAMVGAWVRILIEIESREE